MSGILLPETQVETISEGEKKINVCVFKEKKKKKTVGNKTMKHK